MLVLHGALAGGPVPGEQVGHGEQQAAAGGAGTFGVVGEPAAQQRHGDRHRVGGVRVLDGAQEAGGAADQPDVLQGGAVGHDDLEGVRAQLGLLAVAGGRLDLHLVAVAVQREEQFPGEPGEEAEPQLAVERLRHHQQLGRVPVGADHRAQRRARLARGGQRHQHQRPVGEVAVAYGRRRDGPPGGDRLGAGEGVQHAHAGPPGTRPAPAAGCSAAAAAVAGARGAGGRAGARAGT